MNQIAGLLNLQARSRRSALHTSRLLQARRARQLEHDQVLGMHGAEPDVCSIEDPGVLDG